jgi:hypothetical protein
MSAKPWAVRRGRLWCGLVLACGLLPVLARGQQVHGENSSFTGRGVALVWGVLRGVREEDAQAVLRVALAGGEYVAVSVEGVDPFTQRRQEFLAMRALDGQLDVRTPRSTFADFPRRGIHLYTAADRQTRRPSLTVYFMGLPDTTPEFAVEVALLRYLSETTARLTGK